jgi:hypothetical protein
MTAGAPTLLVRKDAFERAGLTRASIDASLALTDEEFRVERELIAIGPIYADDGLASLIAAFEESGLVYFDDFFEMSGNWPDWLSVFSAARVA